MEPTLHGGSGGALCVVSESTLVIRTGKNSVALNKTSLEMAMRYELPPPAALDINNLQASEKWKKYKLAWTNYAVATELARNQKPSK